jgi:hypothetical protein
MHVTNPSSTNELSTEIGRERKGARGKKRGGGGQRESTSSTVTVLVHSLYLLSAESTFEATGSDTVASGSSFEAK